MVFFRLNTLKSSSVKEFSGLAECNLMQTTATLQMPRYKLDLRLITHEYDKFSFK
jgi:hypothetical protein